jgi:hypothetical protein
MVPRTFIAASPAGVELGSKAGDPGGAEPQAMRAKVIPANSGVRHTGLMLRGEKTPGPA